MKLPIILIYGILFCVTFILFASLWHVQMPGVYFVCRDKGFITDFVPPFVSEGNNAEFFIKPAYVTYTIWAVYFSLAVVLPAIAAWLLVRLHDRALKKSWM